MSFKSKLVLAIGNLGKGATAVGIILTVAGMLLYVLGEQAYYAVVLVGSTCALGGCILALMFTSSQVSNHNR